MKYKENKEERKKCTTEWNIIIGQTPNWKFLAS